MTFTKSQVAAIDPPGRASTILSMPIVLILVGVLAQALASFHIFEQSPMIGSIAFVSVAFAIAGLGLLATGSRRSGAWLVISGSVVFIPLGLVAIFGARKLLDLDTDAAFELRRSQRG